MKLLILGANSDIGLSLAARFAKSEKTDLILASRDIDRLKTIASDLEIRYHIKTDVVFFDALDIASHKKFYHSLDPRPDGVIVSFGYLGNQNMAQENFNETRRIIETNLLGAVSILEIVALDFCREKTGFIIVFSSVAGLRGRKSNYIYGASKGGLLVYLAGLRHRLNPYGVRVMTVLPGFVRTKMTAGLVLPKHLTADPDQIADDVYRAYKKNKMVLYSSWFWRWIMYIIRFMPEKLFLKTNL